jgi:catechol 2,3-dioxygenase-like lactoylglutathione lyase family enzyme
MIETKGVVHFTISVSDTDRSEAFYRDVLGLNVVQKIPSAGMVFLTSGDDYIILTRSKTPIDPNPGKEFLVHHAFRIDVDKYDEAIAHLKDHGVAPFFEEDRRDGIFIGRQAYFHDPDRNVLEISALEKIGAGYGVEGVAADLSPFSKEPPR